MWTSRYQIHVEGKDVKHFLKNLIKMHVSFLKIIEQAHSFDVIVDKENYEKIKKIKTIYQITVVKKFGPISVWETVFHHRLFLGCLILGVFLLYFLTHVIFRVEVIHNKSEIRNLVMTELETYGIQKFHFKVSFAKKEKIVEEILKKHKDKLEWLEIENVGTSYIVRVEERMKEEEPQAQEVRDLVAKKEGIITKIEAKNGEVVKKLNDYVKPGDVIISGRIKNKEETKALVPAEGTVYAETWYQVEVDMPLSYYEEQLTGKEKKVLSIHFLSHTFSFFDFHPFLNKRVTESTLLSSPLLPFSLTWDYQQELNVIDEDYSNEEALVRARQLAEEKLQSMLGVNDRIISQKDLKITQEDSKIKVSIFFKVEEDITSYQPIREETKQEG